MDGLMKEPSTYAGIGLLGSALTAWGQSGDWRQALAVALPGVLAIVLREGKR